MIGRRLRVLVLPLLLVPVLLGTAGCRSCGPRGACPVDPCRVLKEAGPEQCDRGTFAVYLVNGMNEALVGYMWSQGPGTAAHHEVWAFLPTYTPPRCEPLPNGLQLRVRCATNQPSFASCQAFAAWASGQGYTLLLHHVISVGVPAVCP